MTSIRNFVLGILVVALAGCSAMGTSGSNANGNSSNSQPEQALSTQAASVLQRQMGRPPQKRIPKALINGAKCIAVFPSVVQAGFIVGGKRGHGVVSCRDPKTGQWDEAAPAFYTLTGGSVGLQAGVKSSSIILLFLDRDGVDNLLRSHIKLGSDIGITAGPKGYHASIQGAPAPVVSYTASSQGLFAGVNLQGSSLSFDRQSNLNVYDTGSVSPRQVLFDIHRVPPGMEAFNRALSQFAPASQARSLSAGS